MADEIKRSQAQLQDAAQQAAQAPDLDALQEQFANFYTELAKQLEAFRATSTDQMDSNGSGGDETASSAGPDDSRMTPGAPIDNRRNRGRAGLMMTITEELAKDIQSGGPLARSIQQTYSLGRKPTLR
ncbi:MAG: hypothetical protein ACREQI_04630 [Candidatus Binataceae bacterium]